MVRSGAFLLFFILCHAMSWSQQQSAFFHTELFGIPQGLGGGVIGDMRTDQQGMLWLHTSNHLQLFDGKNFVEMGDQVPGDRLAGRFNYRLSEELYFLNNRTLVRLNTKTYTPDSVLTLSFPALPDSGTTFFLFEDIQFLYIAHPNDTLYQVDKKKCEVTKTWLLPQKVYSNFTYSTIGHFASPPHQFEFFNFQRQGFIFDLTTGQVTPSRNNMANFVSYARVSTDTLVVLDDQYLRIYSPFKKDSSALPKPLQKYSGRYLHMDGQDHLLIALEDNLYDFNLRTLSWSMVFHEIGPHDVFNIKIRSIEKDHWGNIYCADFNRGLVKLYPSNNKFQYFGLPEQKNFTKAISLSNRHHLVLMGTIESGLLIFDTLGQLKQQYLHHPDAPGLSSVVGIVKMSEDRFVIIAEELYDLQISAQNNFSIKKIGKGPLDWISYYAVSMEAPEWGMFGFNTGIGTWRFIPGLTMKTEFQEEPFIPYGISMTRFQDQWLLAIIKKITLYDQQYRKVNKQYSIPDFGYLRSIVPYDDHQLLLGTDLGLYLVALEDSARIVRKVFDNLVYAILPGTTEGEFWFSTDYGLYQMKKDFQLNHYSKESGLQENEFNTNSCYKSASGKLYFGGVNGITAFYPEQVGENDDPLLPYVSSIKTPTQLLARYMTPSMSPKYTLSYRESTIEIELLGKGNKAPSSYHYQYWMKGLSSQWIDMGLSSKVNFHLAPGTYTFYYEINDGFNAAATPNAHFTIVIQPPLYRRWWFMALSMAILFGLVFYAFIQHKNKQTLRLMYEIQLNEKLQQERMRISRELHDNIGAQMATVKRNINFLVSHLESLPKTQVESKMRDLETISTQINQELRDTIWAAQNVHVSVGDFITRIKSYVFQVLGQDSPIRVHYQEHCDKEVILGPFIALNLHRISQEAINNIMKHAGATEIFIDFKGDHEHLMVSIADNGTGFEAEKMYEGYGLKNIQKRAEQIGAKVTFDQRAPNGSTLKIEIEKLILSNTLLA